MEVSNMLSEDARQQTSSVLPVAAQQEQNYGHQYPTRRALSSNTTIDTRTPTPLSHIRGNAHDQRSIPQSPSSPSPRNVSFELLFEGATKVRGRLNLRVQIWPHDTTESIVTTVKNFFGLYDGQQGISFEDPSGRTLIASYENFENNMMVYVRVNSDVPHHTEYPNYPAYTPASPRAHPLNEGMPILPPQPAQVLNYGQPPARTESRMSQRPSASPNMSHTRTIKTTRKPSHGIRSQGSSFQAGLDELNSDAHNGYSSSDGGAGSVSSSRKARSEQLASAEISVDNIVEGGRRKRAKFESSELPLYVPPQVPAPNSISSVSPQRRSNGADNPSPFARPTQRTFMYNSTAQSPQAYGHIVQTPVSIPVDSPFQIPAMPNHGHRLRDRTSGASLSTRSSLGSTPRLYGNNVLPTPDPTVASCISDEDVALQLMRLGEVSNFSHGRTSASTLDDALSGRAEVASSGSSNGESDTDDTEAPSSTYIKAEPGPPTKKQRKDHGDIHATLEYSEASGDEVDTEIQHHLKETLNQKMKPLKVKKPRNIGTSAKLPKPTKVAGQKKTKVSGAQPPMSPASLPPQSRKTSAASTLNFQHQLGADEDDLSSKPRCQRCRKSKKGCDRQRPCQRCKDAGIGIDGCVSEEEGNGRKGRYGRHMGVPVKKDSDTMSINADVGNETETASAILSGMASAHTSPEKSKKRKR